jgi:hypothetical protein
MDEKFPAIEVLLLICVIDFNGKDIIAEAGELILVETALARKLLKHHPRHWMRVKTNTMR